MKNLKSALSHTRSRLYSWNYLWDYVFFSILRKRYGGIQLRVPEIVRIVHAIRSLEGCNLLVFGLGNDSPFWRDVNKSGRTVFIEDDKPWFEKITLKYPLIEAYQISYPCNITQWREVLDKPERLAIELPQNIAGDKWDVILVDGPRGNRFETYEPGRMSSIYEASRLVGADGYVFVHDAEREVENAYAAKYLGEDHLTAEVRGRSLLKVFYFPQRMPGS